MSHRKIDYSAEMKRHDSPSVRLLFAVLGTLFVLLGIAGAVLPVLPTPHRSTASLRVASSSAVSWATRCR